MPRRSRSFAPLRQGQRRQTSWAAGPDESAFTSVAAAGVDLQSSANAALLQLRPFTIVRTIGLVTITTDQEAGSEDYFGAFGLCVVSDQASAAGAGSIPTPITESSSDLWLAFTFCAGVGGSLSRNSQTFVLESRGMRKVEEGQDVVSLFENGSNTTGLKYLGQFRFLIKLH